MSDREMREVSRGQGEFPPLLNEIADPPHRLYLSGVPLDHSLAMAVVGTRQCTRYGFDVARWFAKGLAEAGITIVSGMARGIDSAAHLGALDVNGRTVAILGSGVDVCYPKSNRLLYARILESGTLVSEYPQGTRPLPHHFPQRNRIIAGLATGVVVVEGRPDGGAMITARLAAEAGRDVFAVPGPVNSSGSEGPHLLIRDGCRLATSPWDVLEDLGFLRSTAEPPTLTTDERAVVALLGAEPVLIDKIAAVARMPISSATSVLTRLEVRGIVSRHSGGRFSLAPGAP